MADCIFCMIGGHDIPTNVVYEDEKIMCFHDAEPQAPVHVLVIPKKHIASVSDISAENSAIIAKCFEVIAQLASEDEELKNGYRVISNCGPDAGQTVHHLHFHVLGGRPMNEQMV